MLVSHYTDALLEAGCDEAGRGSLAGPVFAAAVILPRGYKNEWLNDSKKVPPVRRIRLCQMIVTDSIAWAVASATSEEIDQLNILQASILAMHRAIEALKLKPEFLLIDGNRFRPLKDIPYVCIIKGDSMFMSIAAASILAKVHRDEYMIRLHALNPIYHWDDNKGYATKAHIRAIFENGLSSEHRRTFRRYQQLKLTM